ncbi:hypothetical protein [Paraburkholderia sp. GAS348]|uniref:hypothetical protein n=1 Tax=Paraburkholderia sp. GAS348 TaxID=3035132 RepID=UPI003D201EF6
MSALQPQTEVSLITSKVRAVRGAIKLHSTIGDVGTNVTGWTALEVDNNTYEGADTFSVTFAASALPPTNDADWFSTQKTIYVEIFAGIVANSSKWTTDDLPKPWIYGQVDDIDYDPVKGTLRIRGRDLTALLIDAKTTEKWQNKTASQIAILLAKRHGLTPQVTPTTTQVGKYYQIDHTTMTDSSTEWDLLTRLARFEQYGVYVRGLTLFFQPRTTPDSATPYQVTWTQPSSSQAFASSSAKGLRLKRALTISRGIVVVVRTWNDLACKVYHSTYPTGKPGPNSQTHYCTLHNATQQACDLKARSYYRELVQHEMSLSAEFPGDDVLDVTMPVRLTGTNTPFDQLYYPASVKRSIDFESGYRIELEAKNSAPDVAVSVA